MNLLSGVLVKLEPNEWSYNLSGVMPDTGLFSLLQSILGISLKTDFVLLYFQEETHFFP